MSELADPLRRVLSETGYLTPGGSPAASTVVICNGDERRRGTLKPDVRWSDANLKVYFKFVESPATETVGIWQQEVWNEGAVPLLWVVEPDRTTLYNGFFMPQPGGDLTKARLGVFHHNGAVRRSRLGLSELGTRAGRLSMETGTFWQKEERVNRRNAVDARLLHDIALLESELRQAGLSVHRAQGLIGRAIFTQYLVDRGILAEQFNGVSLPNILESRQQAERLFRWLTDKFNGDMFPNTGVMPAQKHLAHVASFLRGEMEGQGSLFPYRFDLIPVELISAIYEQFVHSADADAAKELDVHYTPLAAVSLIMDEVMQDITGHEAVLDLTCGSGVFLVEALRRLVNAKTRYRERTRGMVRHALEQQVFGVDKSEAAIQVAAFSLCLAALELDPDPKDDEGLEFESLVGKTLHIGDAHDADLRRKFDVIVGNPPWSYRGKSGTAARSQRTKGTKSPRGVSFDFASRAKDFASDNTSFGMLLSATPFFAESNTGRKAAQELVRSLSPLTLIDLSAHKWLFKKARMPAMGLVARYRLQQDASEMALVRIPWSMAAQNGHKLDVAASDIQMLQQASWWRNPSLFKSGFVGHLHDHLLLEDLFEHQQPLVERLKAIGTASHVGLNRGNQSKSSTFLEGLPFLESDLPRFSLQPDLATYNEQYAERPHKRHIYKAPLVIVQQNMRRSPRVVVAVADEDVVYTQSYFGIPLPPQRTDLAELLAGVLSSAFTSWYLYVAGPDLGLWKARVKKGTADMLPVPDLLTAEASRSGRRIIEIVNDLRRQKAGDLAEEDYLDLDNAVADLYGFDDRERAVIRDGRLRAGWQWKSERLESIEPIDLDGLSSYARGFVSTFDPWFRAADKRRLRAEVYEARTSETLRVVRFILERRAPPSTVCTVAHGGSISDVLTDAGRRLRAPALFDDLRRDGEVRLASKSEIVIAKPPARRHWLAVDAFADARAILEESFRGEVA